MSVRTTSLSRARPIVCALPGRSSISWPASLPCVMIRRATLSGRIGVIRSDVGEDDVVVEGATDRVCLAGAQLDLLAGVVALRDDQARDVVGTDRRDQIGCR